MPLPSMLSYCGIQMVGDNASGLWTVFLTAWVANVAAFVLWGAYASYRLWYVSDAVRAQLRVLELLVPLGWERNVAECCTMMVHVEAMY